MPRRPPALSVLAVPAVPLVAALLLAGCSDAPPPDVRAEREAMDRILATRAEVGELMKSAPSQRPPGDADQPVSAAAGADRDADPAAPEMPADGRPFMRVHRVPADRLQDVAGALADFEAEVQVRRPESLVVVATAPVHERVGRLVEALARGDASPAAVAPSETVELTCWLLLGVEQVGDGDDSAAEDVAGDAALAEAVAEIRRTSGPLTLHRVETLRLRSRAGVSATASGGLALLKQEVDVAPDGALETSVLLSRHPPRGLILDTNVLLTPGEPSVFAEIGFHADGAEARKLDARGIPSSGTLFVVVRARTIDGA